MHGFDELRVKRLFRLLPTKAGSRGDELSRVAFIEWYEAPSTVTLDLVDRVHAKVDQYIKRNNDNINNAEDVRARPGALRYRLGWLTACDPCRCTLKPLLVSVVVHWTSVPSRPCWSLLGACTTPMCD